MRDLWMLCFLWGIVCGFLAAVVLIRVVLETEIKEDSE